MVIDRALCCWPGILALMPEPSELFIVILIMISSVIPIPDELLGTP